VFEAREDQASGLRQLFMPTATSGPPAPALLPLGCTRGDRIDRAIAIDLAEALARAGRRRLLIELFDDRRSAGERSGRCQVPCIDGHQLLGRDFDGKDLGELGRALQRGRGQGPAFETLLLAGDPLRLADLASGLTDRMLLLTPVDAPSLARL